jgi:hypothetical protein
MTDRLEVKDPTPLPPDPFQGRPAWQKKVEEDAAEYARTHQGEVSRAERETAATEQWNAIRHSWARARDIGDISRGVPLPREAEEMLVPYSIRRVPRFDSR